MTEPIQKQLLIVKEAVDRCRDVLGDPAFSNEQTKREFISAVLLPCVQLFKPHMTVRIERKLYGKLGRGPVDYVIMYHGLEIVVTQAEIGELHRAIYLNVAALEAAQQVRMHGCHLILQGTARKALTRRGGEA